MTKTNLLYNFNFLSTKLFSLLIFISLLSLSKLSHSTTSIPFNFYFHQIYFNVKTLTKENHLSSPVDLTSSFTYFPISSKHFKQVPQCINKSEIFIESKSFQYNEYQEQISLEEPSRIVARLPLFNYYIFEKSFYFPKKPYSVWAFGPHINNSMHSITHSLKNRGYTKSNKFSFLFEKDNTTYCTIGGRIYFGDIDSQILKAYKYKSEMKINNNEMTVWNCNVSYIFWNYGQFVINNNYNNILHKPYIAYFDTLTEYIELPHDMFAYIEEEYLGKYIKNRKCKKYEYSFKEYSCDCSIINSFDDLVFLIDNVAYVFTYKDLFFHHDYYCVFIVTLNDNPNKFNSIILGSKFISKYISEFNYNATSITFYSQNKLIHSHKGIEYFINIGKCRVISITLGILLSLFIPVILFMKYKS
jgi:hypothetical protein